MTLCKPITARCANRHIYVWGGLFGAIQTKQDETRQGKVSRCVSQTTEERCPLVLNNTVCDYNIHNKYMILPFVHAFFRDLTEVIFTAWRVTEAVHSVSLFLWFLLFCQPRYMIFLSIPLDSSRFLPSHLVLLFTDYTDYINTQGLEINSL